MSLIILKSRHHSIDKGAPSEKILPRTPSRKACIKCGTTFRGNTLLCPSCHKRAKNTYEKYKDQADGNCPPEIVTVRT